MDVEIQDVITRYFENIFTTNQAGEILSDRINFQSITEEQSQNLVSPAIEEEVKTVIFVIYPEKSPGIDGLNPTFLRRTGI